mmetsp:Transcript_35732/g.93414  ORF Transcript_35732/g.93414 Transcript_35732/m.93414 type:complete len:208 (-) Transcript_35732:59-682(-)
MWRFASANCAVSLNRSDACPVALFFIRSRVLASSPRSVAISSRSSAVGASAASSAAFVSASWRSREAILSASLSLAALSAARSSARFVRMRRMSSKYGTGTGSGYSMCAVNSSECTISHNSSRMALTGRVWTPRSRINWSNTSKHREACPTLSPVLSVSRADSNTASSWTIEADCTLTESREVRLGRPPSDPATRLGLGRSSSERGP